MNVYDYSKFVVIKLIMILVVVGCTQASSTEIHHITALEAKTLIENNADNAKFVILDVRTPIEFSQGHIPGALMLDYHSPGFSRNLQALDKSKTYLIYCTTGYRSSRTMKMIEKQGFNKVYHLQRGIVQWYGRKLPLVKS